MCLTYGEECVDLSRKISVCNYLVLCNADNPGEATSSLLCITQHAQDLTCLLYFEVKVNVRIDQTF